MNEVERKEAIQGIKQELYSAWKFLFVIQLIVGGHAIYELADKYPDMGLIYYSIMLIIGASLIAAVLLGIVVILFLIFAGGMIGVMAWREKRRERQNDSS